MAGVFKTVVTFMVLVFAATVVVVAEVEDHHDVGGDLEWTRPIDLEYYTKWAAAQTFRLGDKLEFEFATGRHDVAIVTKDAYENCDTKTKLLNLMTVSPVKINLNKSGEHYYICTFGDHCRSGQKLAINVLAVGPGAGGTNTTTPSCSNGTTTTTTTPARNAASSLGGATFLVAFVSALVALF